ncbi:serine/threonine-protein kinase PknK, partial [Candidatus Poribacteria bacterium]|nr:serine/threonine-protein kinase PknK [Candidatus Poribacteria bacterium]
MITIPGYKVTGTIYEGAKSIVYRGHREKDNLPVVVKIQKSDYPSPKNIAKFRREYHIGKMLDFNGVIKYYRMEKYKTDHALILEDFGGVALEEVIPSSGMNVSTFLWVAIQLAQALDEVHKKQIIHKDIKPRNIVINTETKVAKLIDFGISSQLSQENQTVLDPNMLEGTLAYMSPEQTGRMNRKADYRSDFYSLGVTFYQMLTSQVPFQSTDPMELVHCHIAVPPPALTELNPEIPKAISDVVMKLLSKTAEDRYQSVYGLIVDLETCLSQFASSGKIEDFVPGKSDVSSKFQIPQKLYGRGQEIEMLLAAFDRVSQGTKEMMFVSGYSGIGKSALVNEIHKPIVRQRGYFISGKIDQFQRNIPYASFIQAFQNLIRQLLTENETQIAAWNEKLRFALGPNGQIIIDVIPEVELIIGKQPPVPELPTAEAQNRFNLVFQNFVRTFTQKEHPLAIFLDDLQWADSPSLSLIELLMSDSSTQHLFLIGAYRDNEVTPAHPLMLTIDEMKKKETVISEINLRPLDMESLNQLTADTLNCEVKRSEPLAELVMGKTGGNPFFATQFLRSIYDEGLLIFDAARDGWQWEFAKIQEVGITDNVVELMAGKIQKLQANTQQILQLAACIGNQFDLQTLAIVHEKSQLETARHLWEAAQEGLIFPIGDAYKFIQEDIVEHVESTVSYKFLHDRVQQAAYSLISENHKQEIHLKIGKLLLANTPSDELEEHIFELVEQLNRGLKLITDPVEQKQFLKLNFTAAKRARKSNAYESALNYCIIATDLLPEDCWESQHDLTFDLYRLRAECEFLCAHYDCADDIFGTLLNWAQSAVSRADVYMMRFMQYNDIGKWVEGIEVGIEALKLFDVHISLDGLPSAIEKEVEEIGKNMGDRKIADLIHSPDLTDPKIRTQTRLFMEVSTAAFCCGDAKLYMLAVVKAVNLSLKYGHEGLSAYAYGLYGMLVGSGMGDFKSGLEFAQLGLDLVEKFDAQDLRCRAEYLYSICNYWRNHLKTSLPYKRAAFRAGLETGDLGWAGYAYNNVIMTRFAMGDELDSVLEEQRKVYGFGQQTQNPYVLNSNISYRQIIHNLKGQTKGKFSLNDDDFDEAERLKAWREDNVAGALGLFWYHLAKMQVNFLYGNYAVACKMGAEAEKYIATSFGFVPVGEHGFYYPLSILNHYDSAEPDEHKTLLDIFERCRNQMKIWADNCPETYLHKHYLVEAEFARIHGKNEEAMLLYKKAITSARENGFTQNEAIANELAARFYMGWGFEEIGQTSMMEARYGYLRGGAT